jgi:hypothetical protein
MDMLDAIAHDLMAAVEHKDHHLFKAGLEALISHVQEMDQLEDAHDFQNPYEGV